MLYKMRDEEFEKVYKIMFESFPVDERRTFDEQIELLRCLKFLYGKTRKPAT